jgi:hypothetical protein
MVEKELTRQANVKAEKLRLAALKAQLLRAHLASELTARLGKTPTPEEVEAEQARQRSELAAERREQAATRKKAFERLLNKYKQELVLELGRRRDPTVHQVRDHDFSRLRIVCARWQSCRSGSSRSWRLSRGLPTSRSEPSKMT